MESESVGVCVSVHNFFLNKTVCGAISGELLGQGTAQIFSENVSSKYENKLSNGKTSPKM